MKKVSILFVFLLFLPHLTYCETDSAKPGSATNSTEEGVIFKIPFRKVLEGDWSWLREVPDDWRVIDKALEIKMEPIPEGGVRNILFRKPPKEADGPFVVTVEVKAMQPFRNQYQQAGLYWMQDDKFQFKFVLENIDGQICVFPGNKPLKTEHVVLRLRIDGTQVVAEYQPEATGEFFKAFEAQLPERNDATDRIAIQCWHGPADAEVWTRFQKFSITKPGQLESE